MAETEGLTIWYDADGDQLPKLGGGGGAAAAAESLEKLYEGAGVRYLVVS